MTKLITIPKFAELTGLPYRTCLHLAHTAQIPSVSVGCRRRIDLRWVDQWLASGGYRPDRGRRRATGVDQEHRVNPELLTTAE
jgi:excisionase family DNA binding protein